MSDFYERISGMSQKRLMLLAMELQEKLEAAENEKNPPVAIVGMACRFPGGVTNPEQFWDLLANGVDAIIDTPVSRWDVNELYDPDPNAPGKVATRWGGFLDDIDRFDPMLFGISPREALTMDPQQRVLLEVVWEALERAGYAPDSLAGSLTGMFVGICNGDYAQMVMSGDPADWDMYVSTGNAPSVVSGRVSYILGLQGPAVSIDTACSSSLVATHLACQSLRTGECNMALAGGVNLILTPETTIMLSRAGMMASDGRCKAFDEAADGFVRSEGCGVLVLKRLSDAVADGDQILAVIRGSATNQDGRSNGLTAPNGPSQVSVVRAALANANLTPEDISYIEAHGTGTSLGDPIEVQALGASLGSGHSVENPLIVGTVKANVGHMEAAAGVGGIIKTVLMLQHGQIPPHLHLHQLSTYIPWDDLPVAIRTELTPWQTNNGRLIAGVSSFGFSGTNAHVILEAPPAAEPAINEQERPVHVLALSARTEKTLRELASRYAAYFEAHPAASLADVAYTTHIGRAQFPFRLSLTAENTAQALAALSAYAAGDAADQVIAGRASEKPDVAFLFTGHGSQYVDIGRRLYETQPVFRRAFDRCDELFRGYLDRSLGEIVFSVDGADGSLLDNMAYAQPALFALQIALAEVWLSWGIRPTVVTGHSLGEYAAAVIAGVFSLEDGVKLVAGRGRLMNSLPEAGEMVAVFADETTVSTAVAPFASRVSVAVINAPTNIVISGAKEAIASVLENLKAQGIKSRKLAVAQASHSPLIDPMLDEFEAIAATVQYNEPEITIVSSHTGQIISGEDIGSAAYWRKHIRQPVRFADSIHSIYEDQKTRVFVEIGPNPTLVGIAQRALENPEGIWLASVREKSDDWGQMLTSLGQLFVAGVSVDWKGFDAEYSRQKVTLPTYPFQQDRYWIAGSARQSGITMAGRLHPLVTQQLQSPSLQDIVFETQFNAQNPSFLSHHRIFGVVIMPSPAYLEMVLAAARHGLGGQHFSIENFAIYEALILPEEGYRTVQVILEPKAGGEAAFQVVSRGTGEADWKRHVSGTVVPQHAESKQADFSAEAIQSRATRELTGEDYYVRVAELGLEFGENFRGIRHVWQQPGEALGWLELPEALTREARAYGIHPAFLDACLHLLGASFSLDDFENAYLLIGIEHFRPYRSPGKKLWAHTELKSGGSPNQEIFTSDIILVDESGELVAEATGLQLKRASREALLQTTQQRFDDWFYEVQWQTKPHPHPVWAAQASDFIPPLQPIVDETVAQLKQQAQAANLSAYAALSHELNQVCLAYVVRAFDVLAGGFQSGQQFTLASLKVVPQHQRLLNRLADFLQSNGFIQPSGSGSYSVQKTEIADAEGLLEGLSKQYAAYQAELTLLQQTGPYLADVLRGQCDPLQLLFPNGSLELTERVYQDSPFAAAYNQALALVVASAVADLPAGRSLRVLEIGAGSGSTTAYVLDKLPADRTEYLFTDLSPLFIAKAQEKFQSYTFVHGQLLDIEQSPEVQGFALQSFDLIIAANVLHATADLRQTLTHVKQLLAPDGLLLLLEGTQPQRWVDLTFGLTEGWWKFSDNTLRPNYPLLEQRDWLSLLQREGFAEAFVIPGANETSVLAGQAVIAARGAGVQSVQTSNDEAGTWLIFADNQGAAQTLTGTLALKNQTPVLVTPGTHFSPVASGGWQLNREHKADYQRLLQELKTPVRGIVHLWSLDLPSADDLDGAALQEAQVLNCTGITYLTQAMLERQSLSPLWLVTRGAEDTHTPNLAQSSVWGLGRVIAVENPELWGGLVELDPNGSVESNANHLLTEIWNPDGEDQVAWRGHERQVARLVRPGRVERQPVALRHDAAYLITGGLGGLGLQIARWMAEQGAGHLVLLGRKGLPERETWASLPADSRAAQQVAVVEAIEKMGTAVSVLAADTADEARMSEIINQFGHALPPLKGVIHAAVDMTNYTIAELDTEKMRAMFQPKIAGTWNLHRLTRDLELDFFVLFSSTTALWGAKLLGHYAAANVFVDAFAQYRHSLGLPAISINWGTWDVMRVSSAADQQEISQSGLNQMPSAQALQIMQDLMGTKRSGMTVAAVEWELLKALYEARRARPFLEQVSSRKRQSVAASKPEARTSDLIACLQVAAREQHEQILVEFVQREAAHVLRVENADSVDVQQGLFEMGMDSLMSVELKNRLEAGVEQSLPSTLTFNYPTIADLAHYLVENITALKTAETAMSVAESQLEPLTEAGEPLPDEIDDLSEDELADLLARKLGYDS